MITHDLKVVQIFKTNDTGHVIHSFLINLGELKILPQFLIFSVIKAIRTPTLMCTHSNWT